jgi:nucleotide-binding universal stress UspA family protein
MRARPAISLGQGFKTMIAPPETSFRLTFVIGLGFNDADGPAFDHAARVARRVPGSVLHLVHVFDEEPSEARARELVDHLRLYVNEKVATLGGFVGMTVGIHLRAGEPTREIAQLAGDVGADLIVLGAHQGLDPKSWVTGSTAGRLGKIAPCPVFVVSPRAEAKDPEVPRIEPPCIDCIAARKSSRGAEWWCARHASHARRAHTFSYQRELPLATHDSEVIPTGIRFA